MSVCEVSKSSCFLSACQNCPGINFAIKNLETILVDHEVKEITYSQWVSTDRYQKLNTVIIFNCLFSKDRKSFNVQKNKIFVKLLKDL